MNLVEVTIKKDESLKELKKSGQCDDLGNGNDLKWRVIGTKVGHYNNQLYS
jgi:hypothetical protein